jgi:polyferredoxin
MTSRAEATASLDVLRWPLVGPLLRWRHFRTSAQMVLLIAAAAVVAHGFAGPDIASGNLSTVLVWVHYRGLLVIALLAAGNMFCGGCPFIRVRDWGRRLHAPTRLWPARLRGKWVAIALFVAILFAYELFDLWALPRSTAWLVLAYFAAALAIDMVFTGATFCKHLCPIGQFNFIASTLSPLELRIRTQATCDSCQTSDCISGRRSAVEPGRIVQRGCELGLFLPAKVGSVDCTFCLDCVQACPHDNIAIGARMPAVELADDGRRSGIGRLSARPDIALLAVLFVFGAFMNAFAMTAPVYRLEEWLSGVMGTASEPVLLGSLFLFGLGVAPIVLVGTAAIGTRALAPAPEIDGSTTRTALSYVFGLVPLGFGVWVAHYGFHFLTGALVVVPVTQSAVLDLLGWAALGVPLWGWAGVRPGSVVPIQIGCALLGAAGSAGVIHLISMRDRPDRAGRATLPWVVLIAAMLAAATWIFLQPMEMRGTGFGA